MTGKTDVSPKAAPIIMSRPLIIDDCPVSLFKAYSEQQWAEALITRGVVRMRKPAAFRQIEGARADTGEGASHLLVPGEVPFVTLDKATGAVIDEGSSPGHFNYQSQFINPTFVFCAAGAGVDRERLARSFGEFIVEITSPHTFLARLNDSIGGITIGDREWSFIDAFAVRYTRGHISPAPHDSGESLRLNYGQKAEDYRWENEFRTAAVLSGPQDGSPETIDVVLGSLQDIAVRSW
jgi:hypothetical protein